MNHDNFLQLFLNDTPLLDVRAPVEFEQGHFPTSENAPLLNNEQREKVGLRYKEQGQDAAIELGWELASDEIQQQRLNSWRNFIQQHPEGKLYCFRGGLRSQLSQQLLHDSGIDYPIVPGGYKAMRRFLIDELDHSSENKKIIVIAGPTGSGKTKAIHKINRAIDLEGRANHRGSVFGAMEQEQPPQISYENQLSIDWLKLNHEDPEKPVFVEDEGRLVGRVLVPPQMKASMQKSSTVAIEEPIEQRIEWVMDDYVRSTLVNKSKLEQFEVHLQANLLRISKRLGGTRHKELAAVFQEAGVYYLQSNNLDGFKDGIRILLEDYYDPMYHYQFQQHERPLLFKGSCAEVAQWCNEY